ncbi:MAG: IPTL-CTERM sorting domain-containing protein [Burkholderiaceae bacterium]|jgi:uncharacterized repeat protein (TIGR01451 family)|nr:IPTL-CTERM sorting domain-containing protein [Burkholderiaceae bacterium]
MNLSSLFKVFFIACFALLGINNASSKVLMITANDTTAAPIFNAAITEFGGASNVTHVNTLNTASSITNNTFTTGGPYDTLVVLTVYATAPPAADNLSIIKNAIANRTIPQVILFTDGCSSCTAAGYNWMVSVLMEMGGAPFSTVVLGAYNSSHTQFPLNTQSSFSGSFTNLNPMYGNRYRPLINVPANNVLYRPQGGAPTNIGNIDAYTVILPARDSNNGQGSCLITSVDASMLDNGGNNGKIGTAMLAAMEADASCKLPQPATLNQEFSPSSVSPGTSSQLTITLSNPNAWDATGVNIADLLPSSLNIISTASTCGATPTLSGQLVTLNNGSIPANGQCTITVDVQWSSDVNTCNTSLPNTIDPAQGDFSTSVGVQQSASTANIDCQYSPPTYTVGGQITGLQPGTTLQVSNGSDVITLTSNGQFVFPSSMGSGVPYAVTIGSQPQGAVCSLSNGSGQIADSNVTNILIECKTSAQPTETTPVPTLSEWALIGLSFLLGMFGLARSRRRCT